MRQKMHRERGMLLSGCILILHSVTNVIGVITDDICCRALNYSIMQVYGADGELGEEQGG